jgi:hypothetical protein
VPEIFDVEELLCLNERPPIESSMKRCVRDIHRDKLLRYIKRHTLYMPRKAFIRPVLWYISNAKRLGVLFGSPIRHDLVTSLVAADTLEIVCPCLAGTPNNQ